MKGWVYIITNESMLGLLKVGFSTKDPSLRAKELDNTGSPKSYNVEYEILVNDPRKLEKKVHVALKKYNCGKEWFNCGLSEAVSVIESIASSNFYYKSDFKEHTKPVRGTSTPLTTRNSACECGSGKKYKHCCGSIVAREENEGGWQSPASLAKAITLANGGKEQSTPKSHTSDKSNTAIHLTHMSAKEFSKLKDIPETIVIEGIRDGFYAGKVINEDEWYVRLSEINNQAYYTYQKKPEKPKVQIFEEAERTLRLTHMSAKEFSKLKGIPETVVIEGIRDGFYAGKVINEDEWYVRLTEINSQSYSTRGSPNEDNPRVKKADSIGVPDEYDYENVNAKNLLVTENNIDISMKEFLIRIFSTLIVLFIVSYLVFNILYSWPEGIAETTGAILGGWLYFSMWSLVLPVFWIFGLLMLGKRIRKRSVLKVFYICVGLVLLIHIVGYVHNVNHPLSRLSFEAKIASKHQGWKLCYG